jgi:hypothetical protein
MYVYMQTLMLELVPILHEVLYSGATLCIQELVRKRQQMRQRRMEQSASFLNKCQCSSKLTRQLGVLSSILAQKVGRVS